MKSALHTLLALSLVLVPVTVSAQEDWWFDVEVIVFDRGQSLAALKEQFERAPSLAPVEASWDLLSALYQPDISQLKQTLPQCDKPASPVWAKQRSLPQITGYRPTFDLDDLVAQKERQHADTLTMSQRSMPADAMQTDASYGQNALQVSQADIAKMWLAFHGPEQIDTTVNDIRFCEPEQPWITWENNQWHVYKPDNRLPYPDEMPVEPEGYDDFDGSPHVLSAQAQELTKLSQQVRQTRGLTRLLHTTWRQPVVFGKNKAASVRLFAGKDYGKQFTATGLQRADTNRSLAESATQQDTAQSLTDDDFFSTLRMRLRNAEPVTFNQMMAVQTESDNTTSVQAKSPSDNTDGPIWQLDGYLKVYLKNINRVPYLHIDSKLFYRQPVPLTTAQDNEVQPDYELVAVPFHQMRRVISKQLHYFDHPLFGMVVKIRRFKVPQGS